MSPPYLRPSTPFQPKRIVSSSRAQTVLARVPSGERAWVVRREHPILLDGGPDETGYNDGRAVRLLGYYNRRHTQSPSRGLVLTLHGWEGSSHSSYNLVISAALLRAGFDVFRLNLRDHGPGLHLNPYTLNRGVFLGTLIQEAAVAARQAASLSGGAPFFITGTSMGGNFALRLALWFSRHPLPNLARVIAINPAINPGRSIDALDARPPLRRYFRRLWVRSLRAKQRLFPTLYNFEPALRIASVRGMTDWLVRRYTHFRDADDYFDGYALTGAAFRELAVPATIITALDDALIPVVDFYALASHPLLDLQIHPKGGHVGYVDVLPYRRRLPQFILDELRRAG